MKHLLIFSISAISAFSISPAAEQSIMVDRSTDQVVSPANIDFSPITLTLPDTVTLDAEWNTLAKIEAVTGADIVEASDITLSALGLDNIDNTADADKPISTATQAELALKIDGSALNADNLTTGTVPDARLPVDVAGAPIWVDGSRRVLPVRSSQGIYVSGDSMSKSSKWPGELASLLGVDVFSSAIGGSKSESQLQRLQGVELDASTVPATSDPAAVYTLHWDRHNADHVGLTNDRIEDKANTDGFKSTWIEDAALVSTPSAVEVFNDGKLIGFATRITNEVTTDYATSTQKLYWTGHTLSDGDQVTVLAPDDPQRPALRNATADYVSPWIPTGLYERRIYYVANAGANDFELKEYTSDASTIDIGSDAAGPIIIEAGWEYDFDYDGSSVVDLSFKARTQWDARTFVLQVATNDINRDFYGITTESLWGHIEQMVAQDKRLFVVSPGVNHSSANGPGSNAYDWIYETYWPYAEQAFGDLFIKTNDLYEAYRLKEEADLLTSTHHNGTQLRWIRGTPSDPSSWEAFSSDQGDTYQMWIGKGFTPLQFRASFSDVVHVNSDADAVLAAELERIHQARRWVAYDAPADQPLEAEALFCYDFADARSFPAQDSVGPNAFAYDLSPNDNRLVYTYAQGSNQVIFNPSTGGLQLDKQNKDTRLVWTGASGLGPADHSDWLFVGWFELPASSITPTGSASLSPLFTIRPPLTSGTASEFAVYSDLDTGAQNDGLIRWAGIAEDVGNYATGEATREQAQQVAVHITGGNITLYIDGVLAQADTVAAITQNPEAVLQMGGGSVQSYRSENDQTIYRAAAYDVSASSFADVAAILAADWALNNPRFNP